MLFVVSAFSPSKIHLDITSCGARVNATKGQLGFVTPIASFLK
jgi:hypothetical protein